MSRAAKDNTLPAINLLYSPLFVEVRKDSRFKELFSLAGLSVPSILRG